MIVFATPTVAFEADGAPDPRITHTDVDEAAAAVRDRQLVILPNETVAAAVLVAVGCTEDHAWHRVYFAKTGELNPYNGQVLATAS
jgi:hypothetical protein